MAVSFFQPDIASAVRNSEVFCPQKDYRSRHYIEQAFVKCMQAAKLSGLWTGKFILFFNPVVILVLLRCLMKIHPVLVASPR